MSVQRTLQKYMDDWKRISHFDFCLLQEDNSILVTTCDRRLPAESKLEEFRNSTALCLSNATCCLYKITEKNEDYYKFKEALHAINVFLAKKIAGDGEGATALFEVKIIHARSKEQAVTLAKSVVTSSLTKAAIYGHDANWGRILCALGYSQAEFHPDIVDIYFESKAGKIKIVENGMAADYSEERATEILSEEEVTAVCDMKMGTGSATAWGCDLTHEYVSINADYRS
jgi:glutamate N-acetyltransferase/amino-acid N-acetyltransferase